MDFMRVPVCWIASHDEDIDAVLQAIRDAISTPELQIRLKERENYAVIAQLRKIGFLFSQICKYLFSLFPLPKNDDNTVDLTK
jgi:hypothetical protein